MRNVTLNASGSTSATTIQIMHPAAKPVQKGRNLLNASAHKNEGTATMGCNKNIYIGGYLVKEAYFQGFS